MWYWHGGPGQWEFYDNAGFRSTGEKLQIITQEAIDKWKSELADAERRTADDAAKAEQERLAAQQVEAAKQAAEEAKQAVEADKERATRQVGENCDRLAANPTDQNRPSDVPGVEYNDLKLNAQTAADACALAVQTFPNESRYRYNWGRALEFINPGQALKLYSELADQHYVAVYDNYGGVLWRERHDLAAAIKQYVTGVQLGDPSAMVSLAYLIKHHLYNVTDPTAAREALLKKAAEAGHKGAQEMLDQDQQEFQAHVTADQNRQVEEQMMINLFGAMVHGATR